MMKVETVAEIFETMDYGPAPESAEPAQAWLDGHNRTFGIFIDGKFVDCPDHFETINPARNELLAYISHAGSNEVEAAVSAARRAQKSWGQLAGHARARHLYALARAVQRHARLFAVLETLDNGKPIRETRDIDIPLAIRHFYHHAGWAQLCSQEFPEHEAIGVVGAIIPWNFPLLMLAWKVAPALAAGCTVVLKPAEQTPLSALLFAEIARDAGLPPGVLNIITGDGTTGAQIVGHTGIDKIAFTGSTEVGRVIRKATAGSGKRLTLELGGKSPFVVFEDADLDSVVEGVVDAIWFNGGQVCCAGSRLIVQEGIAERLEQKLRVRMNALRVGDPLDKAVDMGAIVSPLQLERISELVEQGKNEGLSVWQADVTMPQTGCFYPPTLVTNVAPSSSLAQVEIFGPVLVSMSFRTPNEAVAIANNTAYGLAASIWTENINLALDIAPKLEAGVVWINSTNLFDASVGFGGVRESGFGREGGREGLIEYLRPTWMHTNTSQTERAKATKAAKTVKSTVDESPNKSLPGGLTPLDRTPKLFISGKQTRPDSGYSRTILSPQGHVVGEVGDGNRKDIRNAVEAAHAAQGWALATAHNRAQILYYIAENLEARAQEFAHRIQTMTDTTLEQARFEVEAAISRLFSYGAWADKFDGSVHSAPLRGVALAMREPVGVLGIVCPEEAPLLGLVSLIAPAIALGNRVVVVPSEQHPLSATDFYSVLETSDLPAGVLNIVTGSKDVLAKVLAEHDDVAHVWYFGSPEGVTIVEASSTGNLKRTWANALKRNWLDPLQGEGHEFLEQASRVKNIWIPYGE